MEDLFENGEKNQEPIVEGADRKSNDRFLKNSTQFKQILLTLLLDFMVKALCHPYY